MSNTISDVSKKICTGCGACYNACPVNAIKMQVNSEGFLFPEIDSEICTDCGLCYKQCPAENSDYYCNNSVQNCYAICANDEIRIKSSSGGVFGVVAEAILDNGGYVCGAAWDDSWHVEHILISDKKDLYKLQGSKYLQSDTGKVFSQIKELLNSEKTVFFTGCPCQVAGLKHYLGKDYENLYTADILCHGAPSPKAFDKFLLSAVRPLLPNYSEDTISNFKKYIHNIEFRNKQRHGWAHSLLITMENGAEYDKSKSETSWYSSFLNILNCRSSCGNCRYASIPRQGDITMGDFWGIEKLHPELNDGKGVSVVTINNSKGASLFEEVSVKFIVKEDATVDEAKIQNWNLVGSSKSHKERKRFFELLNTNDNYDKITEYALKRKFDIGYIGWWYGQNYGSVLTNFALHQYLKSRNYSVLMIEWPLKEKPSGPVADSMSRNLAKKYYDVSIRRTFNELPELNWFCDMFVLGSDQLWNYWSIKDTNYFYFLDFVEDSKKKIAYSTSFGHPSFGAPKSYLKNASYHMNRFDAISVREKDGCDICKYTFGVDAVQTMDPVFICDKQEYVELIKSSKMKYDKPYIFAYILTPTAEKRQALIEFSEKTGLEIKLVLDLQSDHEKNRAIMDMDDNICDSLEIEDWLSLISNCEYVFTDSYHGACFSVIFEKELICIANVKRGLSRFKTLFELIGIEDRMIFDPSDYEKVIKYKINYKAVNRRLNTEIVRSRQWLDDALSANKPVRASTYDIVIERMRNLEKEIYQIKSNMYDEKK